MLGLHYFNRLNKVLLFNPLFSSKLRVKSWKICFILIEVLNSAENFSSFPFFDSGTVKRCRNLSFRFSGIIFFFAALQRPGIEPGSIAWQATILPLNHRCFIQSAIIVPAKFCSIIQVFNKALNQNHKKFVSFQLRFRIQANYFSSFPLFWQCTVKNWKM